MNDLGLGTCCHILEVRSDMFVQDTSPDAMISFTFFS